MPSREWGIIGNFGDGTTIGGQIIKSLELRKAMQVKFRELHCLDFKATKRNPILFIFQLWQVLYYSQNVVIILATPGYLKILPVISLFNLFLKRNLYEIVIGGVRHRWLSKRKVSLYFEKKIRKIYVESQWMVSQYKQIGLLNVSWLPNFKSFTAITSEELLQLINENDQLHLCTFSRIDKMKGIDVAIEIVNEINGRFDKAIVTLDIIGPVNPEYKVEFEKLLNENSNEFVNYCGKVDTDRAVATLKRYDVMLFPTNWIAEGFPGVFIDAMAVGLPVLANDRMNFRDVIQNGYNGYLIQETSKIQDYQEILWKLFSNRELLLQLRKNALSEAKKYETDTVLQQLWDDMSRI